MRRRQNRFLRVARRVAEALGREDCLLAGGLAVMAHGFVRATRDVDLITRLPLREAQARLRVKGLATRLLRGDALGGDFACLKGECEGLPFDVLPQLVPVHWDAAPRVDEGDTPGLRVLSLPDLLALKLKAGGAKDLMDAAVLVRLHPEADARARELATAYRSLDRYETWLRDPRTRQQAREEAEWEARLSRPPAGRPTPRAKRAKKR